LGSGHGSDDAFHIRGYVNLDLRTRLMGERKQDDAQNRYESYSHGISFRNTRFYVIAIEMATAKGPPFAINFRVHCVQNGDR